MSNLKAQLASFQHFGTPFYLYQKEVLSNALAACLSAAKPFGYHVHYALKANANPEILKMMIDHGFGADAVSGNEISAALKAGFSADKIAFAGVGKADWEIELGLASGIFSFNCESIQELEVIQEIATKMNCKANIALRLNPNINAKTHKYITTGLEENKFGINFWELDATLAKLETLDRLTLTGIHFHIGSQITDIEPYKQLAIRASEAVRYFEDRNIRLQHLNLGGGLGIDYQHPEENIHPDFDHFFQTIHRFLEVPPYLEVHFELGRSLVANCGSLISKVLYIKEGAATHFAILDAGMTELIRPALYQAYHKIENLTSTFDEERKYDVVGPICESSDCFGKAVVLPITKRGDLIAIRSAGAYGEVMSSNYNLREKAPSVFI